jgi:hypothetical protein
MHINLCKGMLLLNSAWDFLSAAAIWCVFCTKDVVLLGQAHHLEGGESHDVYYPPCTNAAAAPLPSHRMQSMYHFPSEVEAEDAAAVVQNGRGQKSEEDSTAQRIASMHTAMWTRQVDSANHAACMLMAWWVVTLGCMRLLAAIMWGEWLMLAILSYGIEAAAFLGEGLKSTMIPRKACPASVFSMVCLLICATTYFQ